MKTKALITGLLATGLAVLPVGIAQAATGTPPPISGGGPHYSSTCTNWANYQGNKANPALSSLAPKLSFQVCDWTDNWNHLHSASVEVMLLQMPSPDYPQTVHLNYEADISKADDSGYVAHTIRQMDFTAMGQVAFVSTPWVSVGGTQSTSNGSFEDFFGDNTPPFNYGFDGATAATYYW